MDCGALGEFGGVLGSCHGFGGPGGLGRNLWGCKGLMNLEQLWEVSGGYRAVIMDLGGSRGDCHGLRWSLGVMGGYGMTLGF